MKINFILIIINNLKKHCHKKSIIPELKSSQLEAVSSLYTDWYIDCPPMELCLSNTDAL